MGKQRQLKSGKTLDTKALELFFEGRCLVKTVQRPGRPQILRNCRKGWIVGDLGASMLSHAIPSRFEGVNGAILPLSPEYAWTEHTSKDFPKVL